MNVMRVIKTINLFIGKPPFSHRTSEEGEVRGIVLVLKTTKEGIWFQKFFNVFIRGVQVGSVKVQTII